MKVSTLIALLIWSSQALATGGPVDQFLMGYSADSEGTTIITNYRNVIRNKCGRDVTVDELKVLVNTSEYQNLNARSRMSTLTTSDFKEAFASVPCN